VILLLLGDVLFGGSVDMTSGSRVGRTILLPDGLEVELGIGTGGGNGLGIVRGGALLMSSSFTHNMEREEKGTHGDSVDIRSIGLGRSLLVGLCGFVGRHLRISREQGRP
jgi:hypothetical protein